MEFNLIFSGIFHVIFLDYLLDMNKDTEDEKSMRSEALRISQKQMIHVQHPEVLCCASYPA